MLKDRHCQIVTTPTLQHFLKKVHSWRQARQG